jgi:hypothetical protein
MLIGPSYEWLARRQVATFVAHVGSGPRRFGALIGEILARWLVAEPIDSLRGDAEAKLAAPVAHRRPYFIPLMGLQSALSAAILGMPVAPPLRAAASALDAAQADAKAPHERSTIAGWGVAISTWLGDAELRTRWTRERAALPPQQSEAETAILALGAAHEIASGMLVARPALATMLAAAALEMGGSPSSPDRDRAVRRWRERSVARARTRVGGRRPVAIRSVSAARQVHAGGVERPWSGAPCHGRGDRRRWPDPGGGAVHAAALPARRKTRCLLAR